MGNWTKGEWKIIEEYAEIRITSDERIEGMLVDIANMETGFTGRFEFEQKANARLISAAPDMAEALEYFIQVTERRNSELHPGIKDNAIEKAKKALSKAKGE